MGVVFMVMDFLDRIGLDKCIAVCIALIMSAMVWADSRYVDKNYAVARNDAFDLVVTEIRTTQLAQVIRATHEQWCRIKEQEQKDFYWAVLEDYQKKYKAATENGRYVTSPCHPTKEPV